ncbi:MAG TPA: hypothetical protein VMR46_03505 [Candidatus Paceibacterota bacterium]|nr:hypothetical protein [Candidatus Paceibacterota bacterium]
MYTRAAKWWTAGQVSAIIMAVAFIALLLVQPITGVSKNSPLEIPVKIISTQRFLGTGEVILLQSDRELWLRSDQTKMARQWEEQNPGEILLNCDHGSGNVLQCEVFKPKGG